MSGTETKQEDTPNDLVVDETLTPDAEQSAPESDDFNSEDEGLPESIKEILSKNRRAVKEAEQEKKRLKAQLSEFEEAEAEAEKAKLSDIERAQSEAKESQANAEKYQAELLKMRIAGKHGVTDEEDIELFLTGSDEETLIRQAERLAQRNSGPNNPKPDPSAGPKGEPPLTEAEKVAQAEKSGDKQAASILKAQQLGKLAQNT